MSFAHNDGLELVAYRLMQLMELPTYITVQHYTAALKKKQLQLSISLKRYTLHYTKYPLALIFEISVFVLEKRHSMLNFNKVVNTCFVNHGF